MILVQRRDRSTRRTAASCRIATPCRTALRDRLTERLGPFPLFQFWGPATTIASTRWIADATRMVMAEQDPTLTLVYLPHLDYDLQRFGPDEDIPRSGNRLPKSMRSPAILPTRRAPADASVVILSEYGITKVDRPIHINRALARRRASGGPAGGRRRIARSDRLRPSPSPITRSRMCMCPIRRAAEGAGSTARSCGHRARL